MNTVGRERTGEARSSSTSKTWALYKNRTRPCRTRRPRPAHNPGDRPGLSLSTCDLPVSYKGPPHCYGTNEDSPSTGPSPSNPLRTPHPRPRTPPPQSPTWRITSPFQQLTLGHSLRQMVQSPEDHLQSPSGHSGATRQHLGCQREKAHSLGRKHFGLFFFLFFSSLE